MFCATCICTVADPGFPVWSQGFKLKKIWFARGQVSSCPKVAPPVDLVKRFQLGDWFAVAQLNEYII